MLTRICVQKQTNKITTYMYVSAQTYITYKDLTLKSNFQLWSRFVPMEKLRFVFTKKKMLVDVRNLFCYFHIHIAFQNTTDELTRYRTIIPVT